VKMQTSSVAMIIISLVFIFTKFQPEKYDFFPLKSSDFFFSKMFRSFLEKNK
jgi:hypothetical protein